MTSFIQFFDTNLEMGTSITNNQNYGNLIDRIVHIGLGIQTVLTVSIHNTK